MSKRNKRREKRGKSDSHEPVQSPKRTLFRRDAAAGDGSQTSAKRFGHFRRLSARAFPLVIGAAAATPVVLWLSISFGIGSVPVRSQNESSAEAATARTFYSLCEMSEQELSTVDIAEANLLCAAGLPGSDNLEVDECLKTLDRWAEHVRQETDRHLYRFQQNPSEYNDSEGYFRILMLISVLQEDADVHYNPDRILTPDFSNALDLFIHGMIDCENGGTCSSMPVLYTAVARRLGYPVNLVLAKGHVFCRWDGPNDRFNIEGTGHGLNTHPDEHYMTWPHRISEAEVEAGKYLQPLSPREELAVFLSSRGHCLDENGEQAEANVAYALAHQIRPETREYLYFLANTVQMQWDPGQVDRQRRQRRDQLASEGREQTQELRERERQQQLRIDELNRQNQLRAQSNFFGPSIPGTNPSSPYSQSSFPPY